ncbi:MAG: hypothetical protein V4494_07560 [Chlamydiota bacterium]
MQFKLRFSEKATLKLQELELDKSKKGLVKQIRKVLGFMEVNLKHPSLYTHKFPGLSCKLGDVFETYAQNNTPGAYRIFWAYGPNKNELYILDMALHP